MNSNVWDSIASRQSASSTPTMPSRSFFNHLAVIAILDGFLERRPFRSGNALDQITVFEDGECWHLVHPKLLCDIWRFFDIIVIKPPACQYRYRILASLSLEAALLPGIGILLHHLIDERSNSFALRAPCRCAFQDGDSIGIACLDLARENETVNYTDVLIVALTALFSFIARILT